MTRSSRSPPSPLSRPVFPFPTLTPVHSTFTIHHRPTRSDGFDNNPAPLPSDSVALERRLTSDPDLEGQMAMDDEGVGPPPEGGREAWGCVAGAFLVLFCVFGFVTSFGQLEIYYMENQLKRYSKSSVAWIASVQTTLTFAGSIFSGRYFDSHGARALVISGTTLSFASLIALAFCKEYYQFILAHAAFGLSGSILYSPATAVAGHWFLRRRSTAVGIVMCGSGLAGVIYPIALNQLFKQLNFRDTMLIIAGMNAVLMFPSWFILKARLPPRTPPPYKSLLRPWRETRYACLVIGASLLMANWLSPFFNGRDLCTSNNLSSTISEYSIAIIQTGSFFGRVVSGILADTFGVWNMYVTMGMGCAISLFAFWTAAPIPPAAVVVGMIAYGLTSGAWISLVAASTGAISPTREFGMRLGMLWSISSIGTLAGPVICGVLISADDGKFTYAGVFCGLTAFIGTTIAISPRILDIAIGIWNRSREKKHSIPVDSETEEVK